MNNNGAQLKTSAPRFQFSVSSFSVFQLPAVLSQQQTTAANGKKTLAIYLQRITWHVKHFIARIFQFCWELEPWVEGGAAIGGLPMTTAGCKDARMQGCSEGIRMLAIC